MRDPMGKVRAPARIELSPGQEEPKPHFVEKEENCYSTEFPKPAAEVTEPEPAPTGKWSSGPRQPGLAEQFCLPLAAPGSQLTAVSAVPVQPHCEFASLPQPK